MRKKGSQLAAAGAMALVFAIVFGEVNTRSLVAFQLPECVLTLGPTPSIVPAAGITVVVPVLARNPAGCVWEASSSMPFATATAQVAQNQVTLQFAANISAAGAPVVARAVAFTIGNQVVRVVQTGDPAATPWHIGDVFVGAGSDVESSGVYKTLAPQGRAKPDTGLLVTPAPPVADLFDGAGSFSSGCMVDPTRVSGNGDLFTASWKANTLSIFDGVTHQLRDVIRFVDPNTIHPYDALHEAEVGVNTLLAAMPRAAGVAPLPVAAIGVADDPATPADEYVTPEIQAFEQVVFAADGQLYIGTQSPPLGMGMPGLGHGYLLRFRYDPLAASKLTLTGWWRLDAGAMFSDGHTIETSGVDQFDLSDQGTIFYTSEDSFIRSFNVNVAGGAPGAIRLKDTNGQPMNVQAYGIRILPGAPDASGNAAGDGSAGFLVATNGNMVFRVDAQGKTVARYPVPNPFALNLTPDAQFFWTADQHTGDVYRFHIASGAREKFDPGAPGVFGLCVKREYSAATSAGQCFNLNADGSYSADTTVACRTPTICSAVPGQDSSGQPNDDCFAPGFTPPIFPNQGPDAEGTAVSLDMKRPGIVVKTVLGLAAIEGVTFNYATGMISGTIGFSTCAPAGADPMAPTTCVFNLQVQWLPEADAGNPMHWQATTFTWTVTHGNAVPVITLGSNPPVTRTILKPATILLKAQDRDFDFVVASVTGLPPGLSAPYRTWAGDGWSLNITGIPAVDPNHGPAYPVAVDVWDCSPDQANGTNDMLKAMKAAGASAAAIDAALRADVADAIERGTCYHAATSLRFTINVVNTAPTLDPAPQSTLLNTPVSYQIPAHDADGHALTWTIENLPAGLTANASGLISGTPTLDVNGQLVNVTVADEAGASVTKTFPWTVYSNRPPVCLGAAVTPRLIWAPNHKLVPFSIGNITDPDGDAVNIVITSITQNQPVNDNGDGDTGFDATGVGTSTGTVRAERTGNLAVPGDGRVYTVNFTASDGKLAGTCGGTVLIGVPHDQGQRTMPVANGCQWNSVTGAQIGACAWLDAPPRRQR